MNEEESQEKRKTPNFMMKDGVKTWIVQDENYSALKQLTDALGGIPMTTASYYHSEQEAIDQEYSAKMRDLNLQREEIAVRMEKHKVDVAETNRILAFTGRPLIPTPWITPEPRTDDVDVDDDIANGDFDEDNGDYDEGDDFNEEAYEDLDE